MKLLLWGDVNSIFVYDYARQLRRSWRGGELHIDIITARAPRETPGRAGFTEAFDRIVVLGRSPRRFGRIRRLSLLDDVLAARRRLASLEPRYDCCHVHFVDTLAALMVGSLARRSNRLVASIWGSDFLRASTKQRLLKVPLIQRSKYVTFAHPQGLEAFRKFYRWVPDRKLRVCRFGLSPLSTLRDLGDLPRAEAKERWGFGRDRLVVAIGYCGSAQQRHLEVIEHLTAIAGSLPSSVLLVVPMTYGGTDAHRDAVRRALQESGLPHRVLSDFLNEHDVALLRKAADIMINVPTTDQFSGSMLEHVYARTLVLNGAWLPYQLLRDRGGFTLDVNHLDELGEVLLEAIAGRVRYEGLTAGNPEVVWDLMSWERNIQDWMALYGPAEREPVSVSSEAAAGSDSNRRR